MMNVLITICARGGSKGFSKKNIQKLNGVPLIAYSISVAKELSNAYNGYIALSTDDPLIKSTCAEYGVETDYHRPDELAGDSIGKIAVINHLLNYSEKKTNKKYDFIIDLDVTSPLRTLNDVKSAFEQILSNKEANNIFSVSPAGRNPYFNMIELNGDGSVRRVKEMGGSPKTRQSAPPVYELNASFYIYRRRFFEKGFTGGVTPFTMAYIVPHTCFDIDKKLDLDIMNYLVRENLLDFDL